MIKNGKLFCTLAGVVFLVYGYLNATNSSYIFTRLPDLSSWGHYKPILGVLISVYGVWLIKVGMRKQFDRKRAAEIIESFINGTGRQKEWDQFLNTSTDDVLIREIQRQCIDLPHKYPPE